MPKRDYDAASGFRSHPRDLDDDRFEFGGRSAAPRRSHLTIPWFDNADVDDEYGDDYLTALDVLHVDGEAA